MLLGVLFALDGFEDVAREGATGTKTGGSSSMQSTAFFGKGQQRHIRI